MESKAQELARGRGKETLFRVTFRQQINHISIADNKANMIININTLIIAFILTVLGSGISIEQVAFLSDAQLAVPFAVLLVFSLGSVTFGILAAKPVVIGRKNRQGSKKVSKLFFGYISKMSQQDYLDDVMDMLSSNHEIYSNLIIDIHNQGRILNRKYYLLGYAFTLLMIGLIAGVVSFLAIWIYS